MLTEEKKMRKVEQGAEPPRADVCVCERLQPDQMCSCSADGLAGNVAVVFAAWVPVPWPIKNAWIFSVCSWP